MTKLAKLINGKKSQTLQQAKNKKKLSIFASLGCLALIILFIALCAVAPGVSGLFIALAIISMLVMIFFYLKLNCARKEVFVLKNLFCPNCGERFLRDDVTYETVKRRISSSRDGNSVKTSTYATVNIKCPCGKCGKIHEFTQDFVVDSTITDLSGKVSSQSYTVDERIDELFSWQ